MRRIGVLAVVLSALVAPPAAAATCERRDEGPVYTVRFAASEHNQRLVLCDRRRGTERTLAETRGTAASYLGRAYVAGRRVTWPEVRVRARGDDAYLVRMTLPTGRPVRTLAATRPPRAQGRHGTVGLEDGDRTLRWDYRYHDLRPLPTENGCPVRERFRQLSLFGDVQVTMAAYGGNDFASRGVFRVCRHGSGRDPVFTTTFSVLGDGDGLTPAAAEGDVLTVERRTYSRTDDDCVPVTPERYSVSTGAFLGAGDSRSECRG